ncbi:hypothetical protein FACS1894172_15540 [Spirochaetia bacterium]|nr:hypothetical protein FACS1894172_15540 [Spirochaetia bacterium]
MFEVEASNENLDLEQQRVLQRALLNSKEYFLTNGVVSKDHLHRRQDESGHLIVDDSMVIGEPVSVYTKGLRTFVRGILYKSNTYAREFIKLLQDGSTRVKASVGGLYPVVKRGIDGAGEVVKVLWNDLALTVAPVNPTVAPAMMTKSLNSLELVRLLKKADSGFEQPRDESGKFAGGGNNQGDTNKEIQIKKLLDSKPIEITGKEISESTDFVELRKQAREYGRTVRGTYTNEDTGAVIPVTGGSIKETLEHDYKDLPHLQSIAAIPQIIENSIYIDEIPNEDIEKHRNIVKYQYFVAGLKIGGVDYTVKAVVAVDKINNRYYDHKLTQIEKGRLLSSIQGITSPSEESNPPLSDIEDKRLLQILQPPISVRKSVGESALQDEAVCELIGTMSSGIVKSPDDIVSFLSNYGRPDQDASDIMLHLVLENTGGLGMSVKSVLDNLRKSLGMKKSEFEEFKEETELEPGKEELEEEVPDEDGDEEFDEEGTELVKGLVKHMKRLEQMQKSTGEAVALILESQTKITKSISARQGVLSGSELRTASAAGQKIRHKQFTPALKSEAIAVVKKALSDQKISLKDAVSIEEQINKSIQDPGFQIDESYVRILSGK